MKSMVEPLRAGVTRKLWCGLLRATVLDRDRHTLDYIWTIAPFIYNRKLYTLHFSFPLYVRFLRLFCPREVVGPGPTTSCRISFINFLRLSSIWYCSVFLASLCPNTGLVNGCNRVLCRIVQGRAGEVS